MSFAGYGITGWPTIPTRSGESEDEAYREALARDQRIAEQNDADQIAYHTAKIMDRVQRAADATPDGFLLPGHQAWMEPEAS